MDSSEPSEFIRAKFERYYQTMNSYISIYLHFVWGTWDGHAFIRPEWERDLWAEIRHEVLAQQCRLLALGGTENHVHMLTQFRSTLTVAEFIKQVKGASSLWVNDQMRPDFKFAWQGSYGVFSVGRREVPEIIGYIKKQKQHHAQGTLVPCWERMDRPTPSDDSHE